MIDGTVTIDGVPQVVVEIAGREWIAVIDTGFNGDLELPRSLQSEVDAVYFGPVRSILAAGQMVEEDGYDVRFPFDGKLCEAQATFVDLETILIGTRLLKTHRLTFDFTAGTVRIQRSTTNN